MSFWQWFQAPGGDLIINTHVADLKKRVSVMYSELKMNKEGWKKLCYTTVKITSVKANIFLNI